MKPSKFTDNIDGGRVLKFSKLFLLMTVSITLTGCAGYVRPALDSLTTLATTAKAALSGCNTSADLGSAGGSGTQSSPFLICSTSQFQQLNDVDPTDGNYFSLVVDLDFTGVTYHVVYLPDSMIIEGNKHTISNISLNLNSLSADYASVFGYVGINTTIQNFNFDHIQLQAANGNGTGVFGDIEGLDPDTNNPSSYINNITVTNSVALADVEASLFASQANDVSITGIKVYSSSVAGGAKSGGVIGESSEGLTLSQVEANVNIIAGANSGAFAGILNKATVDQVAVNSRYYVTDNIQGLGVRFNPSALSSFVGSDVRSTFSNIAVTGQFVANTTGDLKYVGGFFGSTTSSTVDRSYLNLTGQFDIQSATDNNVGHLMGKNSSPTFTHINEYVPTAAADKANLYAISAITGVTQRSGSAMLSPTSYSSFTTDIWTKTANTLPILAQVQTTGKLFGTTNNVIQTKVAGPGLYLDSTLDGSSGLTFADTDEQVDFSYATLNFCNNTNDPITVLDFGTRINNQISLAQDSFAGTISKGANLQIGDCFTLVLRFAPDGSVAKTFNDIAYVKVLDTTTNVTEVVSQLVNGNGLVNGPVIADDSVNLNDTTATMYVGNTYPIQYTVTNTGTGEATIDDAVIIHTARSFQAITVDPSSDCLPSGGGDNVLAPGGTCKIQINFAPAAAASYSDMIQISYEDDSGNQKIANFTVTATGSTLPFPCSAIPSLMAAAALADGSVGNPYYVCSDLDLERTTTYYYYHFIQMANISITIDGVSTGSDGTTVMNQLTLASNGGVGTYDGNSGNSTAGVCGGTGCTLTVHSTIGGLWSEISMAVVQNLNYTGTVSKTDGSVGGLVDLFNQGTLNNVVATNLHVTNNAATTNGSTSSNTGGLVGYGVNRFAIENTSVVNPTISGTGAVGGIVGWLQANSATISDSSVQGGTVTGTAQYIGGVAGLTYGVTIDNSYSTAHVISLGTFDSGHGSENGNYVGGFIGFAYAGHYNQNFATGAVDVNGGEAGGFVGYTTAAGGVPYFTQSFATGNVTCTTEACGGFNGTMSGGSISDSFSSGSVTGLTDIGGFSGGADDADTTDGGAITNCFSVSSSVTATSGYAYGFIGKLGGSGTVTTSYYYNAVDAGATGPDPVIGSGVIARSNVDSGGGVGLIDSPSTYTTLDFATPVWSSRATTNTPNGTVANFPVPSYSCIATGSPFNGQCDQNW